MGRASKLYSAIVAGDQKAAVEAVQALVADGLAAKAIVDEHMVVAMDEVGRRFDRNEYFVPELLIAARAMKSALEVVRPMLIASKVEPAGRVAIGTVRGDLHDIGKNLVASMMEGGGFEIIDLGVDVPGEKFVEAVTAQRANVVCLSALLTTTMPGMKDVITAIEAAGKREAVKVLVGGAPVTQAFATEIGADGYASNASQAVTQARVLLGVAHGEKI